MAGAGAMVPPLRRRQSVRLAQHSCCSRQLATVAPCAHAAMLSLVYFADIQFAESEAPCGQALVSVVLPLSRCQYAQLAQQPLEPPAGWPPAPADAPGARAAQLGLKLTAGLEMLYWRAARAPRPADARGFSGLVSRAPGPSREAGGGGQPGRSRGAPAHAEGGEASGASGGAAPAAPAAPVGGAGSSPGERASSPAGGGAGAHADEAAHRAFLDGLERSGYFAGAPAGAPGREELLRCAAAGWAAEAAAARRAAAAADPARRMDELLSAPVDAERLERVLARSVPVHPRPAVWDRLGSARAAVESNGSGAGACMCAKQGVDAACVHYADPATLSAAARGAHLLGAAAWARPAPVERLA